MDEVSIRKRSKTESKSVDQANQKQDANPYTKQMQKNSDGLKCKSCFSCWKNKSMFQHVEGTS